jgi:hypothetical protein
VNSENFYRSVKSPYNQGPLFSWNIIKPFDFSTLWATLPHSKLNDRLKELVQLCYTKTNSHRRYKYFVLEQSLLSQKNTLILKVLWNWYHQNAPGFNESGRFGALTSDSTHHFFRNACTKSGSLRFSQFSGCWLILSVYIIMSFDFPFVRLFGVR